MIGGAFSGNDNVALDSSGRSPSRNVTRCRSATSLMSGATPPSAESTDLDAFKAPSPCQAMAGARAKNVASRMSGGDRPATSSTVKTRGARVLEARDNWPLGPRGGHGLLGRRGMISGSLALLVGLGFVPDRHSTIAPPAIVRREWFPASSSLLPAGQVGKNGGMSRSGPRRRRLRGSEQDYRVDCSAAAAMVLSARNRTVQRCGARQMGRYAGGTK